MFRFVNDERSALHAFLYGPRNCIGKNMAYYEMPLSLAKLMLNFEIEICPEAKKWLDQKSWVV